MHQLVIPRDAVKRFKRDELKRYNGKGGISAYFAYKGKIYDVIKSRLWLDGDHIGQHSAGRGLTQELPQAPHSEEQGNRGLGLKLAYRCSYSNYTSRTVASIQA